MSIYRCMVFGNLLKCSKFQKPKPSVNKRFTTMSAHPPVKSCQGYYGVVGRCKYKRFDCVFQIKLKEFEDN